MHAKNIMARSVSVVVCAVLFLFVELSVLAADSNPQLDADISVNAAVETLRQAALGGSAKSQYELGGLFEYGQGVKQNDSEAVYWYEKSAAQDFASAQYRLAILYDNGWGSPANKEKAFELYNAAAEKGVELAQHDLAIVYFQGSGTVKNLEQAYKWLRIAELSGNALMQKHLKLVAAEMSLEEIEKAKELAAIWFKQSRK